MSNLLEAAKEALQILNIYKTIKTIEKKNSFDELIEEERVELRRAIEQAEKQQTLQQIADNEQELNIGYATDIDDATKGEKHMSDLLTTAKTALDALVAYTNLDTVEEKIMFDALVDDVIADLKTAIDNINKHEPVAWAESDSEGNIDWYKDNCFNDDPAWLENPMPLYKSPQQREWVSLTDLDIDDVQYIVDSRLHRTYARAIEAKLKEKNNE